MSDSSIGNSIIFSSLPEFPSEKSECGYVAPVPNNEAAQAAIESRIESLLNRTIRITVVDGRVYQGSLYCYDSDGNFILTSVARILPDGTTRMVYSLMAPLQHITKVELDESS